jgi:hypothetical protein
VLRFEDGRLTERVVLYTCPDGAPFARKVATYEDSLAPSFLFEDVANGVREGVKEGERRRVFFRGVDQKLEKSVPLQALPGLVVDSGFDEFIRSNWHALMTAGPLSLQFLVPSRLETMNFQVQHVRSGAKKPSRPRYVSYSENDHILVRYEGMSDLRDKAGENIRADIRFRPRDRKPSDAVAAASAMSAPLVACR